MPKGMTQERKDRLDLIYRSLPIKTADIPTPNKYGKRGDLNPLREKGILEVETARYEKDDKIVLVQPILFDHIGELFY